MAKLLPQPLRSAPGLLEHPLGVTGLGEATEPPHGGDGGTSALPWPRSPPKAPKLRVLGCADRIPLATCRSPPASLSQRLHHPAVTDCGRGHRTRAEGSGGSRGRFFFSITSPQAMDKKNTAGFVASLAPAAGQHGPGPATPAPCSLSEAPAPTSASTSGTSFGQFCAWRCEASRCRPT